MHVFKTRHICRADFVEAEIVGGGLHLGQPRRNVEHVEPDDILLPLIRRVLLIKQGDEPLEIRHLLIGL